MKKYTFMFSEEKSQFTYVESSDDYAGALNNARSAALAAGFKRGKPISILAETLAASKQPVQEVPVAAPARFEDGHGWLNMYESTDGSATAGGIYTSKAGAQTVAAANGRGGRNTPTLISWDNGKRLVPETCQEKWSVKIGTLEPKEVEFEIGNPPKMFNFYAKDTPREPQRWLDLPLQRQLEVKERVEKIRYMPVLDGVSVVDVEDIGLAQGRVAVSFSSCEWQRALEAFENHMNKNKLAYARGHTRGRTIVYLSDLLAQF